MTFSQFIGLMFMFVFLGCEGVIAPEFQPVPTSETRKARSDEHDVGPPKSDSGLSVVTHETLPIDAEWPHWPVLQSIIPFQPKNAAPVLSLSSERTATVGEEFRMDVSATDSDLAQTLLFELTDAPTGALLEQIGSHHANFRWTPTDTQLGSQSVSIKVSDSGAPSRSDVKSVAVNVLAANHPPVLTVPSQEYTLTGGTHLDFTVTATDADPGDTLLITAKGLPPEASFNQIDENSGRFTWTVTPGCDVYVVNISASDGKSLSKTSVSLKLVCGANEVCEDNLQCECLTGFHSCFGTCVSNYSVNSCGESCTPCPNNLEAASTCINGVCGIECGAGLESCRSGCCAAPNWVQQTPPTSPSVRTKHAMAFDSSRQKVILFGGDNYSVLGDTWEYDVIEHTWLKKEPTLSPSARFGHAMIFDSTRNKVVLLGGATGSLAQGEHWEYDSQNNTWQQVMGVSSPPPLVDHSMVYDFDRKSIVVFGGRSGTSRLNSTWEYDSKLQTWTLETLAHSPTARDNHAMYYDGDRKKVVLFGGYSSTFLNDTWEYDGQNKEWNQQSAEGAPLARYAHVMIYDSNRRKGVLFGGYSVSPGVIENLDDSWEYDGTQRNWIPRPTPTRPSGRFEHSMIYDAVNNKAIMFGGFETESYRNLRDTWEF